MLSGISRVAAVDFEAGTVGSRGVDLGSGAQVTMSSSSSAGQGDALCGRAAAFGVRMEVFFLGACNTVCRWE